MSIDIENRRKIIENSIYIYISDCKSEYRFNPIYVWFEYSSSTTLHVNINKDITKIIIHFTYYYKKPFKMEVRIKDYRRSRVFEYGLYFTNNEAYDAWYISEEIIKVLKVNVE